MGKGLWFASVAGQGIPPKTKINSMHINVVNNQDLQSCHRRSSTNQDEFIGRRETQRPIKQEQSRMQAEINDGNLPEKVDERNTRTILEEIGGKLCNGPPKWAPPPEHTPPYAAN